MASSGTPNRVTTRLPLIDSLTPHKMFRRDFCASAGFPGKRLEDQLYMVRAYFRRRHFHPERLPVLPPLLAGDGKTPDHPDDPRSYYANLARFLTR
jgi:hypothetical protein